MTTGGHDSQFSTFHPNSNTTRPFLYHNPNLSNPGQQPSQGDSTQFDHQATPDSMPLTETKFAMGTFENGAMTQPSQTEAEGKSDRKQKSRGPTPLKTALFDFTQNTTLHGIRFIFMDHVFILRRLVWLLLFLTCSVLMSVQIIERIVYYYGYPITVNVHVNFNKSLSFPALTICNQNAFRATSATDHHLYRLIEQLHSRAQPVTQEDLEREGVGNLSLADLYLQTAHDKEDLIVSCEWQGRPCSAANFSLILTDHGVCYNFNHDMDNVLWVASTGADYGLKLSLNVEQYEYMPGPHDAAGIKILLHDQREFPKVAELGLAVPTGTHTYVGIQLLKIRNLPAPHGKCRSEQSPYYTEYSQESCHLACLTVEVEKRCGCRHFFMPHIDGRPPVCTLEQYISCYAPNIDDIKEHVRHHCECPVPCDFLIYDPTISFASTSMFATDTLLADTSTAKLREKFLHARETTAKMDPIKLRTFQKYERDMHGSFEDLKRVIRTSVRDKLNVQQKALAKIYDQMEKVYTTENRLLRWQLYHVKKNFIRAKTAMEERTLYFLALGFQEFSYQVEARIKQMGPQADGSMLAQDVRNSLYLEVMNMLNGRIDLSDRAHANYTQLYESYLNGTPIFRYKFEDESRHNNIYITPKPLLRKALVHNSYAKKYSVRLGESIYKYKDALIKYTELANNSYFHQEVNETELHLATVHYLWTGRSFHFSKSTFYAEALGYPVLVLEADIEDGNRRWRRFHEDCQDMHEKVTQLLIDLQRLDENIVRNLDSGLHAARRYIEDPNITITKMQVAEDLTSDTIYEGISTLKVFFADIRSRGQNVYDGWTNLVDVTNDLWASALQNENLKEYYEYKNMSTYLRNYTEIAEGNRENFTMWREEFDFRFVLGNVDSAFLRNLDVLMKVLTGYIDSSYVDSEFIRKNFLQLDVFYREKSYEQITQQQAYDVFALFCDIGGSMGLFVGASAMTICEVLDLGIHQSLQNLAFRGRIS